MSIESAAPPRPTGPPEAAPPARGPDAARPRSRRAFADRLADEPAALLAAALGRPGVGPLREAGAPVPIAAPRPVAQPPPTLESQGVVSLRVRTVDGQGEVTLRVRQGEGLVEVRLRESPRSGLEVSLAGSVPEAELERLSGVLARRLGPEARVEIGPETPPRHGHDDPRDRRGREDLLEIEELEGSQRRSPRRHRAWPG